MPPDRARWIVWAAMLGAVALYAGLATVLPPLSVPDLPAEALLAFAGAGIGAGVAALAIHRTALVRPILGGELEPHTPEGATRALRIWIVCWALAESVGILGLAAAFVFGRSDLALMAAAIAVLLLVMMSPRLPARTPTSAELNRPDVRIGESS